MQKTILIFLLSINLAFSGDLDKAREYFYKATEEEEYIDKSINKFEKVADDNKELSAMCDVYIGSLIALRAKYTFWPQNKLSFANEGIEKMEQALKLDSNNIESLFVYGSTCYYLPFFFDKADAAENALLRIIDLIDPKKIQTDEKLLKNALNFVIDKIKPEGERLKKAKSILEKIDTL